jgi:prepilin-type N-terminal cleavage/methylation domain-containing protein
MPHQAKRPGLGITLPELLIVMTIVGTLSTLALTGLHGLREATRIHAAARSVWSHLALARTLALGRRETVRVRRDPAGDLELVNPSERRLARVPVGPGSDLQMDSIRVRPPTLRFNSRGQAAPGSIYLYLGVRTVRIVSNFLGRLRVESSGPH